MAGRTMDTDMNLAYQLQLQEAINASLFLNSAPFPAPAPAPEQNNEPPVSNNNDDAGAVSGVQTEEIEQNNEPPVSNNNDDAGAVSGVQTEEIEQNNEPLVSNNNDDAGAVSGVQTEEIPKVEQEIENRVISKEEFIKIWDESRRQLHDWKFNEEISGMADDESPYEEEGSSSSRSIANETFRVYFKGEVKAEPIDENNDVKYLMGIGVAITDSLGQLIFETKKSLYVKLININVVSLNALIEALNIALAFDLSRVELYCDHYPTCQFIIRGWIPKRRQIAALVEQVHPLTRRIPSLVVIYVPHGDMKSAIKLAEEAILSQTSRSGGQTCVICLEDKDPDRFSSVDDCMHRYCYSCLKQHVEVKLLNGMLPKCPHDRCNTKLNVDGSSKFLTPKLLEILKQRIKENSIPVMEKFYCPIEKCSALMTKTELQNYSQSLLTKEEMLKGARLCKECNSRFCINCRVHWHSNMSCSEFKKEYPDLGLVAEETKLKRLATSKLWRQCKQCHHMIELSVGCNHMTCRCGYEFCYSCGSPWENKKPTCTCRVLNGVFIDENGEDSDVDYYLSEESDIDDDDDDADGYDDDYDDWDEEYVTYLSECFFLN